LGKVTITSSIDEQNIEQAYQIANALNISASQDPHFTQALLVRG
jgi:hypothetical protein